MKRQHPSARSPSPARGRLNIPPPAGRPLNPGMVAGRLWVHPGRMLNSYALHGSSRGAGWSCSAPATTRSSFARAHALASAAAGAAWSPARVAGRSRAGSPRAWVRAGAWSRPTSMRGCSRLERHPTSRCCSSTSHRQARGRRVRLRPRAPRPRAREVLRRLATALRPGGTLIVEADDIYPILATATGDYGDGWDAYLAVTSEAPTRGHVLPGAARPVRPARRRRGGRHPARSVAAPCRRSSGVSPGSRFASAPTRTRSTAGARRSPMRRAGTRAGQPSIVWGRRCSGPSLNV